MIFSFFFNNKPFFNYPDTKQVANDLVAQYLLNFSLRFRNYENEISLLRIFAALIGISDCRPEIYAFGINNYRSALVCGHWHQWNIEHRLPKSDIRTSGFRLPEKFFDEVRLPVPRGKSHFRRPVIQNDEDSSFHGRYTTLKGSSTLSQYQSLLFLMPCKEANTSGLFSGKMVDNTFLALLLPMK